MSLVFGCVFAFLAVATGAFGAHGLEKILDSYSLGIWQTAAQYQMIHALALVLLGLFEGQKNTPQKLTRAFFLAGIVLFSGSLYLLALTGVKILGAITPLGGLSFMAGWISFGLAALKKQA